MRLLTLVGYIWLSSCAGIPISAKNWQQCEGLCQSRQGVMEMCNEYFRGPGCHCNDDQIIWLDELNRSEAVAK